MGPLGTAHARSGSAPRRLPISLTKERAGVSVSVTRNLPKICLDGGGLWPIRVPNGLMAPGTPRRGGWPSAPRWPGGLVQRSSRKRMSMRYDDNTTGAGMMPGLKGRDRALKEEWGTLTTWLRRRCASRAYMVSADKAIGGSSTPHASARRPADAFGLFESRLAACIHRRAYRPPGSEA
jgi:hypothetical protein